MDTWVVNTDELARIVAEHDLSDNQVRSTVADRISVALGVSRYSAFSLMRRVRDGSSKVVTLNEADALLCALDAPYEVHRLTVQRTTDKRALRREYAAMLFDPRRVT